MMLIMKKENIKNLNLKKLKYLQYIIKLQVIKKILNYFNKNLEINNKMIILIIYYKKNYKINLLK